MATETESSESVCLKKDEKEDNELSSIILEEKVTELLVNNVKPLESGPNQPLETSSQVAETVNTQLDTGKLTNESGTFFHALSVPMATSITPESCEATTTEDQDKRKTAETFTEEKPNDDAKVEILSTQTEPEEENILNEVKYDEKVASEKQACEETSPEKAESEVGLELSDSKSSSKKEVIEKDQGDIDIVASSHANCENIKELTTSQNATTVADFKELDLSKKPREFFMEEPEANTNDAQEASELCENGAGDYSDQKPEESVKKIEQEEEVEGVRPGVDTDEKMEENGLLHDITADACISTQPKSQVETTELDEKLDDETEKSESPLIKKVSEVTGSEKVEYHEMEQAVSILGRDEATEKEQKVNMLEKDQGEEDVTSVQDVTCERGLEDKEHQSDGEVVEANESIKEDTDEIRSTIDTPDEVEQERLIDVVPVDVCVSTQTEPKEETKENVERNDEEAIESDDGQTNKSGSLMVENIHENVSEKAESEEGSKLPGSSNDIVSKNEDQDKEQKLNFSEQGQGSGDEITSSQKASSDDIKETNAVISEEIQKEEAVDRSIDSQEASELCENGAKDNSDQKPEESVKEIEQEEEIEVIRPGVETEEKVEDNEFLHDITADACISTQAKSEVQTTEQEEKNEEAEKSDSPLIKEVSEVTVSEKAEHHETGQVVSVLGKDEDHEKEQKVNLLEKDHGVGDVTSVQDMMFEGVSEDKQHQIEGNICEALKAKESTEEYTQEIRSSIETPKETEQQPLINVISTDICVSTKTEPDEETTENIENNDEETIESDSQTNESGSYMVKKIHEETVSGKGESQEGFKLPESPNETVSKDEDQEMEHELNVSERGQEGGDDITSSQNASRDDTKETNAVISEENQKEESEDRSIDAQEASVQYEDVTNDKSKQKPTVEQQEYAEEIKESDELNEEKNVCISTQTVFQEEAEKDEEKEIERHGDRKEKSDNPLVKEVCDGTDLKENLFEEEKNEKEIPILSKDKDHNKEQELSISEKEQDKDEVTSSQYTTAVSEEDSHDKNHPNEGTEPEVIEAKEIITEDIEETRFGDETPQKMEQSRLTNDIPSDVCISTPTEPEQKATENVESNDEKAIESDDGQTNKYGDPVVKEISETTISEETEGEEELKPSNENKTVSIDENQEKEQKLSLSEKRLGGDDDVTSSQNLLDKDTNETLIRQHNTTVAYFEEAQGLSATPTEISKVEAEDKSIDAQEVSEQYEDGSLNKGELKPEESVNNFEQPCSTIEREEYSEEINPSVVTNEENDVCISAKTESHEEATENAENVIDYDSDGKEKVNNSFFKEVCEDTELKKTELEEEEDMQLSDSSKMNLSEKTVAFLSKDEEEEEEQGIKGAVTVSEEDLQERNYSGVNNECEFDVAIESIQEDIEKEEQKKENYHTKGNEPVVTTTRDNVVEDAQEIRSCVGTNRTAETISAEETTKNEVNIVEEAVENHDDQTQKSETTLVEEVCEATSSEKAESEGVKHSDIFSTTIDVDEIVNTKINVENEHEHEHNLKTPEVIGGENDGISSQTVENEDITETKMGEHATTEAYFEDGQGVSAMTEDIIEKEAEKKSIDEEEESEKCEKPEESINNTVNSSPEIVEANTKEDEKDTLNNREIEDMLDAENPDDITEERSEMKKISREYEQPKEQIVEETHASLTETMSEKTEDEIKEKDEDLSHEILEDTNGNTIAEEKTFSDGKKYESIEEWNCSLDEISEQKFTDINGTTAVVAPEDMTTSYSLETSTNDTSNLEKAKAENDNLSVDDLESVSEVQIPEAVPTIEESKVNEECLISATTLNLDKQKGAVKEEISSDETFEEVYEETSSEKAELQEGLQLSNCSIMEINEKEMTSFNDEDQEKDQEVNISIEEQGKDDVTSLLDAASKEDLLEKNYECESNVYGFVITGEHLDEDTKKINSSMESKESESERSLLKKACEATSSEKAESEDVVENSESSNMKLDENEKVSKEETQVTEPETTISEVQGGGDGVITSENVSNEDITESANGPHATTVTYFEEGQELSAVTKDIIEEETEDKSIDAQEASEQCENGAKDINEQNHEESVNEPVKSCAENVEGNITEDEVDAPNNKEKEAKLDVENHAEITEDISDIKDELVSTESISTETIAVEPQEDIKPSGSLENSTEDISDSFKPYTESESLQIKDLETVSEVQLPEVVPKSEDFELATYVDEEKGTAIKGISNDEKPEKSHINIEENVTQLQRIGKNCSSYEKSDLEEDATKESQLNSTEGCSEMVNDVILTDEVSSEVQKEKETNDSKGQITEDGTYLQSEKEMARKISYADPISVENPEETEQASEDISRESKVINESINEAPKEENIRSLEDAATLEPQVDLPDTESTYLSDSEKLPTQALESVSDVQTTKVLVDSEDSKVKKESYVLRTAECTDENSVEEEPKLKTKKISSAPDREEEHVKQAPTESGEEKKCAIDTDENILTNKNLEMHGELENTSEYVFEDDQVNETKAQPEQSDITSEKIMHDQILESKLELTNDKDLDVKRVEEDVAPAPEDQINRVENQTETTKNVIMTNEVSMEKDKTNEIIEVKVQVSEDDNCATEELNNTLTSNQKESENEQIELSKAVANEKTEVTKLISESQIEAESIPVAKDISCLSNVSGTIIGEVKDDSVIEAINDNTMPVLEDSKASEPQVNLPETELHDTLKNEEDSMKLPEAIACNIQETIEENVLISQSTEKVILEEKEGELISEVQTPKAIVKTEMQEEHTEATNGTCATLMGGVTSEKLLDEVEEVDAKEYIDVRAEGTEKITEESSEDVAAKVMVHERFEQTEEKLVSVVPSEEVTPPMGEEKTNELVLETEKTNTEYNSLGNNDQNPELVEEEFTNSISENQSIKERYADEVGLSNFGVKNTEANGNEVAEDIIVNKVLLEDETTTEINSIKDNINEETIHNQSTSASTYIVSQIERSTSVSNELLDTTDPVEDIEDRKLMAENLKLKDEAFTVMKGPNEDSEIVAPEVGSFENVVTEERIIKTDERKEKEAPGEPQTDDLAKTTHDSVSYSTEKDMEVKPEESKGLDDMGALEERPNEVLEVKSEVAEIVPEGQEASTIVTDNLPTASSEMVLAKHETETPTTTEKIEEEIRDKEVVCLLVEKTETLQVSTLNSEIDKDKQNGHVDISIIEEEALQPQEHISKLEVVDPHIYVEPPHLDTKEATLEEADEHIKAATPTENVKSSTKEPEVKSVDLEIPSVMDATADKADYNEDPKNKTDEMYEALKRVVNKDEPLESTYDSEMQMEPLEIDAPVILGAAATVDLRISQKNVTEDLIESLATESKLLTEKIDASQEQEETTAKSLIAELEENKVTQASTTEPQYSSKVLQEEKTSDEKDKSESAEPAKTLVADMLHEPTKEVAENKQPLQTKDQQVGKEENGECEVKTNEENEEGEVIIEASKDMEEIKVHKKSHKILSGVGSKVKLLLSKVKKALIGKSSHPKPPSS